MHGLLQGLLCQPACDTGQSSKAPGINFLCLQRSLLEKPGLGGFDEVCMGAQPPARTRDQDATTIISTSFTGPANFTIRSTLPDHVVDAQGRCCLFTHLAAAPLAYGRFKMVFVLNSTLTSIVSSRPQCDVRCHSHLHPGATT